jgi:hypothetical protein
MRSAVLLVLTFALLTGCRGARNLSPGPSPGRGGGTEGGDRSGVSNPAGKALGVVVFDVDDDGWLDLLIANDLEPNVLFRNQRDGTFAEIGVESGVAYGMRGRARAGMGIDSADLTGDGREDVLIGNFSGERAALFWDGGGGQFVDVAQDVGLGEASYPLTTFGALFFDADLDGRPDICLVNGHPDENIALAGSGPPSPSAWLSSTTRGLGSET